MIMSHTLNNPRTQAAADSQVLLLLAPDSEEASTIAPAGDDQNLFGRDEALPLDEEIMDFQWFNTVSWDSIKDLRGTTYVQPPPRFKFAPHQARHAIQRAITHQNSCSLASEPAWKALVLSSWLLLGRPAVNASESAHTSWKPDLASFGQKTGQPSGSWCVLSVTLPLSPVQRAKLQQNKTVR